MICLIQSGISYISISFDNGSLGNYFHDNEVTKIRVQREGGLSSPEISIVDKVPRQIYWDSAIQFHNNDPINDQLDNTGKISVALQPVSSLHFVVYPISEAKPSTPFTFWYALIKGSSWLLNKPYEWWGNEFMMYWQWKWNAIKIYNCTVSFMETKISKSGNKISRQLNLITLR